MAPKRKRTSSSSSERSRSSSPQTRSNGQVPRSAPEPSSSNSQLRTKGQEIAPVTPDPDLTFASLGGIEDQLKIVTVSIIIPFLRKEFNGTDDFGSKPPPKGLIFHGPPGTGKTIFAKTLAAELSRIPGKKWSFFQHNGAETFSKYMGESEQNLKLLFQKAKSMSPSILFFDEIDGVAPARMESSSAGSSAYNSVVTTILTLMDQFKPGEMVVIGATNRVESLDTALRRPGRFDKEVYFPPPSQAGRKTILEVITSKREIDPPLTPELLETLSSLTHGYTGADLQNLVSEAIWIAEDRSCELPADPSLLLQDPELAEEVLAELDEVKVLEEDWTKAVQNTKATKPIPKFGGQTHRFLGQSERSSLSPLLDKFKGRIKGTIQGYLQPIETEIEGLTSRLVCQMFQSKTTKDRLIYDDEVIPNILSSLDPGKIPMFILKKESLDIPSMITVLDRVQGSGGIVFIPNIGDLCNYQPFQERLAHYIRIGKWNLRKDNDSRIILIMTSTGTSTNHEVMNLLKPCDFVTLDGPTSEERDNFFEEFFKELYGFFDSSRPCRKLSKNQEFELKAIQNLVYAKTKDSGIDDLIVLRRKFAKATEEEMKEGGRDCQTFGFILKDLKTIMDDDSLN